MLKQKKNALFFSLIITLIVIAVLIIPTISAQMCNVEDTKLILKKALFDYLPNPELSKLNSTEIKDLLNFYLNSSNLTTAKCDVKATLSHIDYEVIIDKFNNYTVNIKIPYCEDGTSYGKCSATKPKYCFAGKLVNRCRLCGCLEGQECQIDEKTAITINEGRWGKCAPITKNVTIITKNITILNDLDGDGINDTLTITSIKEIGNLSGNIIAFVTSESSTGEDLNKDGDIKDYILRYYDINTDKLVNTGVNIDTTIYGIASISVSNNIIAFKLNDMTAYITLSKQFEGVDIKCEFKGCSERKPHYCDNGVLVKKCEMCGCPSGQVCNYTNGSCYVPLKCSDNTIGANCSTTKPLYCQNGALVNNCTLCHCPVNQICIANESCITPQVITNLSDGSAEKNLTFNNTKNQTIYIEVPLDANITNATLAVTPIETNTSLDIGTDGIIDAIFNATNVTQITPDLSPEINEYIINNNNLIPTEAIPENQTPAVTGQAVYIKSGNILVPLTFYADNQGTVKISDIAITYVATPTIVEEQKPSFLKNILDFIKRLFA